MGPTKDKQCADAVADGLYRKFWPIVFRRCRTMLGDDESAADAAQDVFVSMLDKQGRLSLDYPYNLLRRMATNRCLNVIRSRVQRGEVCDSESLLERIACAEDLEERHASRGVLRKLFKMHPESSRTVAVLHLIDGLTLAETALMMNRSVSWVQRRLRALRETLVELEGV